MVGGVWYVVAWFFILFNFYSFYFLLYFMICGTNLGSAPVCAAARIDVLSTGLNPPRVNSAELLNQLEHMRRLASTRQSLSSAPS